MGLERTIPILAGVALSWEAIKSNLVQSGETPIIRMIDDLPAFPDETPELNWKELRLGLSGGMVTIRRSETEIRCVCWGTDDAELKSAFEKVIAACERCI